MTNQAHDADVILNCMVHSCIEGFLESKISEAQVSNLQCPAPSCESPIAAKMIKELVPQLYERYDSFALDSALAQASALYVLSLGCSGA